MLKRNNNSTYFKDLRFWIPETQGETNLIFFWHIYVCGSFCLPTVPLALCMTVSLILFRSHHWSLILKEYPPSSLVLSSFFLFIFLLHLNYNNLYLTASSTADHLSVYHCILGTWKMFQQIFIKWTNELLKYLWNTQQRKLPLTLTIKVKC